MPARQTFVVLDERTEVGAFGAEAEDGAPWSDERMSGPQVGGGIPHEHVAPTIVHGRPSSMARRVSVEFATAGPITMRCPPLVLPFGPSRRQDGSIFQPSTTAGTSSRLLWCRCLNTVHVSESSDVEKPNRRIMFCWFIRALGKNEFTGPGDSNRSRNILT
jgi:hypothetical protein